MTYHATGGVFGSILGFVTDPIVDIVSGGDSAPSSDNCLAQQEQVTAKLDAQTLDLKRNWKPTGFYSVDDLMRMREETFKVLIAANAAIEKAIAAGAIADVRTVLRDRMNRIYSKMKDSVAYANAANTARAKGIRVIDAPGFQRWTIESMNAASNGIGAAAYMACIKPAVVTVVQAVVNLWPKLVALGKAMVRVAIAAGEQILKLPDTLGKVWKYTTWGGLAVLAYYALRPRKQNPCPRRRRR